MQPKLGFQITAASVDEVNKLIERFGDQDDSMYLQGIEHGSAAGGFESHQLFLGI